MQNTITDPRPLLHRAIDTAIRVVDGVTPEHRHLPTPCGDFDVNQLIGHLAFALNRVAAAGRGEQLGDDDEVVESTDWPADLRAIAAAAADAWADDAALTRSVALPWATRTGAETIGIYVDEVTVHTWDLAMATGQHVDWDDEVVALADEAMHRELPMADRDPMWAQFLAGMPDGVEFAPPFANAVAVPADATPIERLVAWTGRSSAAG